MTTTPRRLVCPSTRPQSRATLRTAQASHSFDLANLTTDAASGHPAQRATIVRNTGGTFHCFWHPATTARFVQVAVTIGWRGSYTAPHGVQVTLAIDDGIIGAPITSADPEIPTGFRDEVHWPGVAMQRADSLSRVAAYLDRTALIAAGLDATVPWRLTFVVTCGATVYCEAIEVAEVARFATDTAESYGDDPRNYQPRGVIDNHLVRVGASLEAAYDLNRRTYHATSLGEAAPDVVTAGAYAVIPGSQSESAGVACVWKVRPRLIRGEPRVLFGVRYKTSGAGGGDLRLATGGTGTPYTLALPGTSGTYANVLTGVGYLANASADTLVWTAQVSAGSLSIVSYWVVDSPL